MNKIFFSLSRRVAACLRQAALKWRLHLEDRVITLKKKKKNALTTADGDVNKVSSMSRSDIIVPRSGFEAF